MTLGKNNLPSQGTAAILEGEYGQPFNIANWPTTPPSFDEAVVCLDYSGVCHGDIYSRDGGFPAPPVPTRPLIGGHEGVGKIVTLHEDYQGTEFHIGDLVGVPWRSAVCGTCDACLAGIQNRCVQQKITGLHRHGTYQRYITFPWKQLVRIPDGLSATQACPILCAGVSAYSSLKLMDPEPGKWCVIVGAAGGLGHLAIQYAKWIFGLKVLAIDGGSPEKKDFCIQQGADVFIDFIDQGSKLASTVKDKTDGGADYTLCFSPHQSSYDDAGKYARFGSQIMAIGIGNCHMKFMYIIQNDLRVRTNRTGSRQDMVEALQAGIGGRIASNIHVLKLKDLNLALDNIKAGKVLGKIVVDLRPEY